ncbi:alpha/beta hydrolase [Novosphingobium sp. JCM 18896]|uniref:alpha/beta hydrolase n=1 Tax=Novosphingobium sp. JCM 18896 TaxID=2989731 RepID=UPI002221CC14|nr:alpha/beta hydrolase [Novosphingobium sp. JCM 18896]MCW1428792.1 alpha/beta hydrolase [Novosphingobium sp. JCM 18896]
MRSIARLLLPLLTLVAAPAMAQEIVYADVTGGDVTGAEVTQVEAAVESAVLVQSADEPELSAERVVATYRPAPVPRGVAAYGPFRVLDEGHAALVGVTDAATPGQFAAMLRDHPGIAMLEMVLCPGTEDDRANLRLGLMLRERGVATHVPDGGFVASGAVELFLAGAQRSAEPAALFAVHSWEDDAGRQASDYAVDAPKNRAYLDYYQAVGMSADEARAFYAMTNSVPFSSAKWLSRGDMAQWVRLDRAAPVQAPVGAPVAGPFQLAVLDSSRALH